MQKIRIPFAANNTHRISNRMDNLGSKPRYLSKLLMDCENLSVPIESDIEIFITGIIIPNPTNSIIELTNERVTRKNNPNFDLTKQILKILKKFVIELYI
tara:strand:+ start:1222 stop:1521 length:300 start_codon:yes stop_codon:yes gene_type:complete